MGMASLLAASSAAHAQTGPFILDAEALLWKFKPASVPPLVSTGILGEPATSVLLGGNDLDAAAHGGLRLTGTYGLADRRSIEGVVLYVPTRKASRSVDSS